MRLYEIPNPRVSFLLLLALCYQSLDGVPKWKQLKSHAVRIRELMSS